MTSLKRRPRHLKPSSTQNSEKLGTGLPGGIPYPPPPKGGSKYSVNALLWIHCMTLDVFDCSVSSGVLRRGDETFCEVSKL